MNMKATHRTAGPAQTPETPSPAATDSKAGKSLSMHEDVADWHDCCSCEAEPYWVEAAQELGIDLDAIDETGEEDLPGIHHG